MNTADIEAIRQRYAHYSDTKPHTAVADIRALIDHIDTLTTERAREDCVSCAKGRGDCGH